MLNKPHTTTQHRRRAGIMVAAAALLVLTLSACTPQQSDTIDRVNATRAEQGLPKLLAHVSLLNKAQAWAEHLAATGTLEHSKLSDGVTGDWKALGENVGYGPSLEAVHKAFLGSAAHRQNIVDPRFNWVGTGVAVGKNGTVYVVQVFAQY